MTSTVCLVRVKCTLVHGLGSFLLAVSLPATIAAQAGAEAIAAPQHKSLTQSVKRSPFDIAAFDDKPVPYWDRGVLISRVTEIFRPGVPNVRLYDETGSKVHEVEIWFPGSARVVVSSAAVAPDRTIVASGSAYKADGTRARYIASTNRRGTVENIIQTGDFAARSVCVAPDGSVWAFGGTGWDEGANRPKPGETLRHFDFQKGQIGAFVPRSAFPNRPPFESLTHIRCLSEAVVVYSAQANIYIELPYKNTEPRIYRVNLPQGLRVVGFAVLRSGAVFGHLYRSGNGPNETQGIYSLTFDEATMTARWLPVEGAVGPGNKPGTVTALWGADEENLVLSRSEDPYGVAALHWARP